MVFSSGITNSAGMPQIGGSAGEFVRPDAGRPYQMWLNALAGYLYYDNGTSWNVLKADPISPYTFGTGLTNSDYNISVNLSTGVDSGNQSIIGGNSGDIINPAYLKLIANIGVGPNSYLEFYSIGSGTRYYQDSGNWNFGGLTDTGFLANFEGDVNFNSDIYCNSVFANNGSIADFSGFKISGTGGSGILQMIRNSVTPTQIANETVFFADASGKLSWFNSNGSYLRTFDATGITAARTWTLPDATTVLAGLAVANVFTVGQTFAAGSTSDPSIKFGDSQTGLFRPGINQIGFTVSNSSVMNISGNSLTIASAHTFTFGSRGTIRSASGTPEGTVSAPVGSLYLRTDGGILTTLYVKESGSGNTGWVGK